jgi:hypothetical protein
VAVTADSAGTAAVETGMALPVQNVQKTGPEKWFLDCRLAEPNKKKKPGGLKTRPAWWRQDRLCACLAVGHYIADCQVRCPLPCKP